MTTEAWWCCTCGVKITKVGKKDPGHKRWNAHVLVCPITKEKQKRPNEYVCQGLHIVQMPQGKP